MIDVRRNLNEIMGNIETSAAVFGRNVEDIELIAVTKYVDVSRICLLYTSCGTGLPERKVSTASAKLSGYLRPVRLACSR